MITGGAAQAAAIGQVVRMDEKKFLKAFFMQAGILLALIAAFVIVMDPFYHYHGPVSGLKAVVTKAEYQCIGTVRHFDYDSIVLGSSVAENYNNRWFDEAFGGKTVKGIKSGAATVDLVYYMKEAFAHGELVNVYYCVDISALNAEPDKMFPDASLPLYLYNHNPFDDVSYLWNKDVLFENIPYQLATGLDAQYDEGASYNWAHYKTFSAEGTLRNYARSDRVAERKPEDANRDVIDANLQLIGAVVEAHPETKFRFIFSPYSMLWWDAAYRSGESGQCIYTAERAVEYLLGFANAEVYYFQNDAETITNLDNYMDPIHFSEEINHEIVRRMQTGAYRLTRADYDEELAKMEELVEEIERNDIKNYFDETIK